ncbi:hypothetical protein K4F52_008057 [Lecanicillium sp. MT-2017a]|nr:hypothetical protein K4F52_008057 [Lecanicillium sp. MT-2017a]
MASHMPRTTPGAAKRLGDDQDDAPRPEVPGDDGRLQLLEPEPETSEDSPLLSAADSADDEHPAPRRTSKDPIDDSQTTKSLWYLTLLTLCIGGLQVAWSVELSNGSPYLLSLGLSKSLMALVWVAGPLTGTLVQPYIGMLSDNCRMPWGKRRPFIIGSTIATILSLLFLSWIKEIIGGFMSLFGASPDSHVVEITIIVAAVFGIYILDIAINALQAAIRALIVDCAPAHQQEAANAMASRLIGIGNIVGFIAGYINLTKPLWFLGKTQFQILCATASILLTITVIVSCTSVQERDPRNAATGAAKNPGLFAFFLSLFKSIKRLPPQIMRVCQVQFCGWVGFFPLLFYTSSYIGEIYVQPFLEKDPHMSPEKLDELYEQATRIGSFALLVNSVVSLLTNVLLPFFIAPTYDSQPAVSQGSGTGSETAYRRRNRERTILERLQIPGFTLKRAWFGSLILFSIAMLCTLVARSVEAATALIGIAGITWAMTLWAPYAIISAEIARRDALRRAKQLRAESTIRRNGNGSSASIPPLQLPTDSSTQSAVPSVSADSEQDEAGVIMGIHNMSIAAPQIIANVGSSLIFKIWQKPRGTPGDRSIAFVLAIGGLFVLASAFFVGEIRDDTLPTLGYADDEEHGLIGDDTERTANTTQRQAGGQRETGPGQQPARARARSFGGMRVG